jgi:hypothetical protein
MSNWENRDKKQKAKKNRMPKHGRSILTLELVLLDKALSDKSRKKKKKRKSKK